MKHTKEPWEVKTATFTEKGVAFEVIMPEQVICAGDAHLIEASPKLYEACKNALENLEEASLMKDRIVARRKLRQAIARWEDE